MSRIDIFFEKKKELEELTKWGKVFYTCIQAYTDRYLEVYRIWVMGNNPKNTEELRRALGNEIATKYRPLAMFFPGLANRLRNLACMVNSQEQFKKDLNKLCEDFSLLVKDKQQRLETDLKRWKYDYFDSTENPHDVVIIPEAGKPCDTDDLVKKYLKQNKNSVCCRNIPRGYEEYKREGKVILIPRSIEWQTENGGCNFNLEYKSKRFVEYILINTILNLKPGALKIIGVDLNYTSVFKKFSIMEGIVLEKVILQQNELIRTVGELIEEMNKRFREVGNVVDYNIKNPHTIYPYKMVVLYDCQNQLNKTAMDLIESISKNGYKVGIYLFNVGKMNWTWHNFNEIPFIDLNCKPYVDLLPLSTDGERARAIELWMNHYRGVQKAEKEKMVSINNILKEKKKELPFEDATRECRVEIGSYGNRRIEFILNESDHVHSFVIGKTGSGKSVLLHNIINNLMMKYSPDSLQFYLLDFKFGGVEFNRYKGSKHVRCLMVDESDTQITLEILRNVWNLMQERGKIMRDAGVNNLSDYNKSCKEKDRLPKLVIVVDECHELFKEGRYNIQKEIDNILIRIGKEGRNQQVHLIFATQTIAGTNIPLGIKNNITDPYIMNCKPTDAQAFLPDTGSIVSSLKSGDVYYNPDKNKEGIIFHADFYNSQQVNDNLQFINRKCKSFVPDFKQFYFSGKLAYNICDYIEKQETRKSPRAFLGKEISVDDTLAYIDFKSETASNVLILGINDKLQSTRVQMNILLSLIYYHKKKNDHAEFYLIDNTNEDNDYVVDDGLWNKLRKCGCKILKYKDEYNDLLNVLLKKIDNRERNGKTYVFVFEQDYFLPLKYDYQLEMKDNSDNVKKEDNPFGFDFEFKSNATRRNNKAKTFRDAFYSILKDGPDYGIHCVWQVSKLGNLLFEERMFTKRELFSLFRFAIIQKTSKENSVQMGLADDIQAEDLEESNERLRSYLHNDMNDSNMLYCPFNMINEKDIDKLIKR